MASRAERTESWGENPPRVIMVEGVPWVSHAFHQRYVAEVRADAEVLAHAVSKSLTHGEESPLQAALAEYLSKHPWSDL